jgi:hypothetical protein
MCHHVYTGILPTLRDASAQLTVLVPTDSAFAGTPQQRLNTSNTDTLQTVGRAGCDVCQMMQLMPCMAPAKADGTASGWLAVLRTLPVAG